MLRFVHFYIHSNVCWACFWYKRAILRAKRDSGECNYQVRYAIKEYAATAVDVLARRTRLAFLNVQAAEEALPVIVDIMAEELKWSKGEKKVRGTWLFLEQQEIGAIIIII